jgi:hypothetical protein
MLVVTGAAAQQRWGHGASLFQSDAAASGAALGNKLGAMYAEKKRKGALLGNARAAVTALIETAEPGLCALIDDHLEERQRITEASESATAALAIAEEVLSEWERLSGAVDSTQTAAKNASGQIQALAPRLGEAVSEAIGRGEQVEGAEQVGDVISEIQKIEQAHDDLNGATGFFAKAKAAAQQVALKAQIALAQNKLKGLRTSFARSLLNAGEEASVPNIDALLTEIAEARDLASSADVLAAQAEAERSEAGLSLAPRIGLEAMPEGGPRSIVAKCRTEAQRLNQEEAAWLELTTSALIAAAPGQWPEHGPLREALEDLANKQGLV